MLNAELISKLGLEPGVRFLRLAPKVSASLERSGVSICERLLHLQLIGMAALTVIESFRLDRVAQRSEVRPLRVPSFIIIPERLGPIRFMNLELLLHPHSWGHEHRATRLHRHPIVLYVDMVIRALYYALWSGWGLFDATLHPGLPRRMAYCRIGSLLFII